MAENDLVERLDQAIEAMFAGRPESVRPIDPELATLLVMATDLRDLPDPHFKAELKWKLVPRVRRSLAPHFRVDGVADFITFLQEAFGAEEEFRAPTPQGRIAHAEVRIGDSMVEMGDASDAYKAYAFGIHMYVEDVDAVFASAVRAGATTMHEPVNQFYGDREASVKDPFGNHWYIATHQTAGQPIRPGFRTITPFFHPRGADRMFEFLQNAFGGRPIEEPDKSPDGTIAHATMRIGDSLVEMGEAHGEWQPMEAGIHLYVDDADAAYQRAVEAGATTVMAPFDAPYGERMSYVIDPFGNHWYVGAPVR